MLEVAERLTAAPEILRSCREERQVSMVSQQVHQSHRRLPPPGERCLFIRYQSAEDQSVLPRGRSKPHLHQQANRMVRRSSTPDEQYRHPGCLGWILLSLLPLPEWVRLPNQPESTSQQPSPSAEDLPLSPLSTRVHRVERSGESSRERELRCFPVQWISRWSRLCPAAEDRTRSTSLHEFHSLFLAREGVES